MKLSDVKTLLCIGMPVADVLIGKEHAGDLMQRYGMRAGVRNMLSEEQIRAFESELKGMQGVDVVAGGSLANTASAVSRLCPEVNIIFCAASAKDAYGDLFSDAILDADMQLIPEMCTGTETSRSYVLTDEKGERAVARYLGDSMDFLTAEMIEDAIKAADMVLLEGELPALPNGYALWREVIACALRHNTAVGFTLFGAEQVRLHRTLFMETITQHAAFVFGNEEELKTLYGEEFHDYDHACELLFDALHARHKDAVLCISHGDAAPYLRTANGVFRVAPSPVARIVNTLGAGDGFMAGVFSGLLSGNSEEESLRLGHRIAGAVISQAEPQLSEERLMTLKNAA
jgi:sugar/nucleoside kinase (ribokinase family)